MSHSIETAYVHSIEISTRTVNHKGESKDIDLAQLRINIDRSRRSGEDDNGEPIYDDSRSFWVDAELWGPKASYLDGVVTPGASILIAGRYDNNSWIDKDSQEERSKMVLVADEIAVLPRCVESISIRAKANSTTEGD